MTHRRIRRHARSLVVNLASLASPTTARVAGQRQSSLCASRLERRATGLCWGRPSRVEDADTSGLPVSSFDILREDVWISPIRQFVTIKNRNVFFAETIKSVFVNVGDGAGARCGGVVTETFTRPDVLRIAFESRLWSSFVFRAFAKSRKAKPNLHSNLNRGDFFAAAAALPRGAPSERVASPRREFPAMSRSGLRRFRCGGRRANDTEGPSVWPSVRGAWTFGGLGAKRTRFAARAFSFSSPSRFRFRLGAASGTGFVRARVAPRFGSETRAKRARSGSRDASPSPPDPA